MKDIYMVEISKFDEEIRISKMIENKKSNHFAIVNLPEKCVFNNQADFKETSTTIGHKLLTDSTAVKLFFK